MFQQVVVDCGASASAGLTQSLKITTDLGFVNQLWLDSIYVDSASSPELRIAFTGTEVSMRTTPVLITNQATIASTAREPGGKAIFEMHPFSSSTAGRQIFSAPYPVLEKPIDRRTTAINIAVSDWKGQAITYDRLVLFFRADTLDPASTTTSYQRVLEDAARRRFASRGANEF